MTDRDVARDVGLLLRYALDHTMTPIRHDTYQRLLDRYTTDPELRTAFEETAAGLGVRTLTVDRATGLVLSAQDGSPLAVADTTPWLRIGSAGDRMVYGIALGAAAAWCYPTARAVREPGTRRVTAVDVDRLVREHAVAVEAGETELPVGLGPAWEEYSVRRKQIALTKNTGRLKRGCTVKMCEEVLVLLSSFGLLVADRTIPQPRPDLQVWRSTDRFRAHVAAGGGPLVWQTIVNSGVSPLDEEDA